MCGWRSQWNNWWWIGLAASAMAEPTVEFRADTSSAVESFGAPALQVVLSEASSVPVTVSYRVVGGSAKGGGIDYTRAPGILTFAPGVRTNAIPLSIVDDAVPEPAETVVLLLHDPAGAVLGTRTHHTYTILDDDGFIIGPPPGAGDTLTVEFQTETSSAAEDRSPAPLQVVLSWPTNDPVQVEYVAGGGTASRNRDYTLADGSLVFPPGATRLNIEADITDDEIAEFNETFMVTLIGADGATLGERVAHTYTIKDNDTVQVGFSPTEARGLEGDYTVTVDALIEGTSEKPLEVSYRIAGTATPGADFLLDPQTLRFAPGVITQQVEILIVEDDITEADEDIVLHLEKPVEVIIGPATPYTYVIEDDDAPMPDVRIRRPRSPEDAEGDGIELEGGATLGGEGDGEIELWIGLSGTSGIPVEIEFTAGGTAVYGEDYILTGGGEGELEWDPDRRSGTGYIPPGATNILIYIGPIDDGIEEPDETIIITATSSVGARLSLEAEFVVWLIDNDRPPEPMRFFRQAVAARDPGQILTVVGPKTTTVLVRGLAVDRAGNYYISDQAPTRGIGEGGVWMWPHGAEHVTRIMEELTRPGDLELSLDGRELVIAGAGGAITRRAFGVSVRVINLDPSEPGVYVYAKTDLGTVQAKATSDGYFHLPEILVPAQTSPTIDIIIERGGETSSHFGIPLAQPGFAEPFGQRVVNLEF